MKYLASHSLEDKHTAADGASVVSNDGTDSVSSKVQYEAWKNKQHEQLERFIILLLYQVVYCAMLGVIYLM